MANLPYIKFYPRDWLGDPQLRMLSHHEKGVWFDMLCLMAMSDPYGHLARAGTALQDADVARALGLPPADYKAVLTRLEALGIPSRTDDGTLYSRRMVSDAAKHAAFTAAGNRGGSPVLRSPRASNTPPVDNSGKSVDNSPVSPSALPAVTGDTHRHSQSHSHSHTSLKPTLKPTLKPQDAVLRSSNPAELVTATVLVSQESADGRHTGFYRKAVRQLGFEAYRNELLAFEAEIRAGEEPDNRGAAFTARLQKRGVK